MMMDHMDGFIYTDGSLFSGKYKGIGHTASGWHVTNAKEEVLNINEKGCHVSSRSTIDYGELIAIKGSLRWLVDK